MRMIVARIVSMLVLATWTVAATKAGATTAREIIDKARELSHTERKWSDRKQRLALRITDRRGGVRERALETFYKKYDGDKTKSLLFFTAPSEVKGTGFLQWVDPHSNNQQWLYLPELKRVRQISGSSNRSSFMGTDFSYEDLGIVTEILDWTDADADVALERQEACSDRQCWVLSFVPKDKEVGYGRILMWIDDEYRARRFEMLDKNGEVDKVLETGDLRTVGQIPTAFRWEMRSVRSGSSTVVEFSDVAYDTGLSDTLFTQRRLEQGL